MNYDQVWSYTYDQIEAYVLGQGANKECIVPGGRAPADCDASISAQYTLCDCTVILQALPDRSLGHLVFPRTRVLIDGPGAEEFYHGFYLNFLSGGG